MRILLLNSILKFPLGMHTPPHKICLGEDSTEFWNVRITAVSFSELFNFRDVNFPIRIRSKGENLLLRYLGRTSLPQSI